ncbi:hypothetical protein [Photobacterium halotolerans]|uniref:hypothetical protein n=1 Tax=Photobacterium halotolerans TaxID=265726 RepID=UPI000423A139|nr:hypothetical protein [Photobacterium halotolerans]
MGVGILSQQNRVTKKKQQAKVEASTALTDGVRARCTAEEKAELTDYTGDIITLARTHGYKGNITASRVVRGLIQMAIDGEISDEKLAKWVVERT